MVRQAIAAEALTKYYGKTRGIDHLNLTVEPGDFFGFIGSKTAVCIFVNHHNRGQRTAAETCNAFKRKQSVLGCLTVFYI